MLGDLNYRYDANGRRTQMSGGLSRVSIPLAMSVASYNANNQLSQRGTQSYSYDANGNLQSDGANSYTWDSRNQLTGINGASVASFQYDASGRRSRKTVNGVTTQYL